MTSRISLEVGDLEFGRMFSRVLIVDKEDARTAGMLQT